MEVELWTTECQGIPERVIIRVVKIVPKGKRLEVLYLGGVSWSGYRKGALAGWISRGGKNQLTRGYISFAFRPSAGGVGREILTCSGESTGGLRGGGENNRWGGTSFSLATTDTKK